jgi:hypothetical protein
MQASDNLSWSDSLLLVAEPAYASYPSMVFIDNDTILLAYNNDFNKAGFKSLLIDLS